MTTGYLSLGSNLGDRRQNLEAAIQLLATPQLRVSRVSSLYETAPLYLTDQPWFMNAVVEIQTDLAPNDLLRHLNGIEQSLGRERKVVNGPRLIDADILLYGDIILQTPELSIPHPRMMERRFVLEPLAELRPDLVHPVAHRSIAELLAEAPPQTVTRLL